MEHDVEEPKSSRLVNSAAGRVAAAIVAAALGLGLAAPALSLPVNYSLDVYGNNTSGSIGGVAFTNAQIYLTFSGDTTNIMPFSITTPDGKTTSGYQILSDASTTATVAIYADGGATTYNATFLPAAGIYVSVDNTNGGIGFGSAGVPPTDPTFPGNPVYPESLLGNNGNPASAITLNNYNLATGFSWTGWSISCVGFPLNCASAGPALPTTAGDLILDQQSIASSFFYAYVSPVQFARFNGNATISGRRSNATLTVSGGFAFASNSPGFNPATDTFSMTLYPYTVTLPVGSFTSTAGGGYTYSGIVNGSNLSIQIAPAAGGNYTYRLVASKVNLAGMPPSETLFFNLGYNSTGTTIRIRTRDD
jgi:hypothetical protein